MPATQTDPSASPGPTGSPREVCAVCQGRRLHPFLDLGRMPPANALLPAAALSLPEVRFPLGLVACRDCQLIQLTHIVPGTLLFKGYLYFSSVSEAMIEHFAALANEVVDRFVLPDQLVVEIGSNDGILLQSLTHRPVRILGVDPADAAAATARTKGVPTVVDFFNPDVAGRIRAEHGPAKAILGNNVLAHIPDLLATVQGFDVLAADDGLLVFEFPYVVDFLEHGEFDTVYHEHFYYFGVHPIQKLLADYGFHVFEVRRTAVHGGSLRVFAARSRANFTTQPLVGELLALETRIGLNEPARLAAFAQNAEAVRHDLVTLVDRLIGEGARLAGYTAPAKGNVLLNYCGLGPDRIRYLADATPAKQGLYSPGMHIPIYSPEHFQADQPDYALLLAWNHQDEVLRRESRYRERGGKFIVPIPQVHIV